MALVFWEKSARLNFTAFNIFLHRKQEIYYRDNPERTISLEKFIQQIFTNKHDPLRKNIERIVHLRNISTHFITEDYEYIYAPLFQSCVENVGISTMPF